MTTDANPDLENTPPCRECWANCGVEVDEEMREIDRLEDGLSPLPEGITRIRSLISTLELCHHKAERWVTNVIEAIAEGDTSKGLGTRTAGEVHAAERDWMNACAALSAWCAGCPGARVDLLIDTIPASKLLACLGDRSPLKEWQVQRAIEKIRSCIHWPQSSDDPTAQYVWLLLSAGDYEFAYLSHCPTHYKEHEDFWLTTVRTIIRDTEAGDEAVLSLGLAIDMLMPCHWRFVENLQIVLGAIGGNLNPSSPFAACGRNIVLLPIRDRMETIARTLRAFCGSTEPHASVDRGILARLGEPTPARQWLAASLDKTIRLQLSPPAAARELSALSGPAWIMDG